MAVNTGRHLSRETFRRLGAGEAFACLPLVIIGAAVLWSWGVRLLDYGAYFGDVDHYMYHGARLAAGELQWTREFTDWLPANQFLFLLPGALGSLMAWRLLAMAAALLCAYCIYILARDIFTGLRGMPPRISRYAGLYGAAFTLYILSSRPGGIDKFNGAALTLALAALVLCRLSMRRAGAAMRGGGGKSAVGRRLFAGKFSGGHPALSAAVRRGHSPVEFHLGFV